MTEYTPSMIRATGAVALCAAAAVLAGCAVQARVAAPAVYVPPPPAYVAPPPPAAVVAAPGAVVQVQIAPPALPVYEQPPCPVAGYLWTPGYWAWATGGYYWVPGTWVAPPTVGVLWTPGYWGFVGGAYMWHAGYWGPHVGFYGGVSYGFGYTGVGFAGGRWVGGAFAYNQAVANVNVTVIHNTYNETVVNNVTVNRVSFNGGVGGTMAVPTAQERMAAQEHHFAPTPLQTQHVQEAAHNPALFANANGGHPAIAATARPAMFKGPGVVAAHGANPTLARNMSMGGSMQMNRGGPNGSGTNNWRQPNGAHTPQGGSAYAPNGKAPQGVKNQQKNNRKAQPKKPAEKEHRGEEQR
ncbi:MAG TPA: YXWGXW repeat-containing protein [Steroidobacteraceae bacterium]|nr:YXWGXW repeat-containing protein [Steroidobacteraceae bacterium]